MISGRMNIALKCRIHLKFSHHFHKGKQFQCKHTLVQLDTSYVHVTNTCSNIHITCKGSEWKLEALVHLL